MVDIKPIGIDQTTGQQRPIISGDNVVNNIGDQIYLRIKQVGDYSGGSNQVILQYPFTDPTELTTPASLPTSFGQSVSWSPNGEFLAVGANQSGGGSGLNVYQRVGNTFTRLNDPASAPLDTQGLNWSNNGEFLAVTTNASPRLRIYQRSGDILTLLPTPASVPNSAFGITVSWSPNDEFLIFGNFETSNNLHIYQRSDTTFTRIADPATLPSGLPSAGSYQWSPSGEHFVCGNETGMRVYQRTGLTEFTALTNPATSPSTLPRLAWSPAGNYLLAVATGFSSIYSIDGATITQLNDPASLKVTAGQINWSPDGRTIVQTTAPTLSFYTWDFTTLDTTAVFTSSSGSFQGYPIFSPDGQFVASPESASPWFSTYQTDSDMPSNGVVVISSN